MIRYSPVLYLKLSSHDFGSRFDSSRSPSSSWHFSPRELSCRVNCQASLSSTRLHHQSSLHRESQPREASLASNNPGELALATAYRHLPSLFSSRLSSFNYHLNSIAATSPHYHNHDVACSCSSNNLRCLNRYYQSCHGPSTRHYLSCHPRPVYPGHY